MSYWAVVPAAGQGARMGAPLPKQYLRLMGRLLIEHTLERLLTHPRIRGVVVALAADDAHWPYTAFAGDERVTVVPGGAERCHSVASALAWLRDHGDPEDWVLVHDAARPCITHADLDHLMDTLADHPVGGLLGSPVRDTMKRADASGEVEATVPREGLWHALTPQMFRLATLQQALDGALARGELVTDESAAVEGLGLRPRLVAGRADNLKVTRPEDLALAELYLRQQREDGS